MLGVREAKIGVSRSRGLQGGGGVGGGERGSEGKTGTNFSSEEPGNHPVKQDKCGRR